MTFPCATSTGSCRRTSSAPSSATARLCLSAGGRTTATISTATGRWVEGLATNPPIHLFIMATLRLPVQVTRLTLAPGGRVHFKSRFVRTHEFESESRADAVLFRGTFRTQRPPNVLPLALSGGGVCLNNAFDLRLKNNANTNALLWGDHLLAFFEAGGACHLALPYPPQPRPVSPYHALLCPALLSSAQPIGEGRAPSATWR